MIQFYLSNALSCDLKMHLKEKIKPDFQALQWYAHRVTINRRKCVIAMERQSRYAMVFCGLTKPDFENFPQIFQERLWREVISITQPEEDDLAIISDLVLDITVDHYYQPGNDRSVMAHINQVVELLDIIVNYYGEELPLTDSDAFTFGIRANETPRKRKNDTDYFYPIEVFRDLWLGMFNIVKKSSANTTRTYH